MWESLARAEARLEAVDGSFWYFAILGLEADFERIDWPGFGFLRAVEEPPNEIFLLTALGNSILAGALGRYSRAIRFELAVERQEEPSSQGSFDLAWVFISALRARSLAELLIPAVADVPWSAIAAAKSQLCRVQLIEDVPRAHRLQPPVAVTTEDALWAHRHLGTYRTLLDNPAFRLASEAMATHQLQYSDRMMAAHLWAGIEALFDIQAELRFRLAAVIASLLAPRGGERRDMYKRIQRLYDIRSKAVHGGKLSAEQVRDHIVEVRSLLSRLLQLFVEHGRMYSQNEIELAIFG